MRNSYYYNTVPHAVVLSGSFWWRGVFSNIDDWRAITICHAHDGTSILLWEDPWARQPSSQQFPRLFSYARDKLISLNEFMSLPDCFDGFHLPLSTAAFQELGTLRNHLDASHFPDRKSVV